MSQGASATPGAQAQAPGDLSALAAQIPIMHAQTAAATAAAGAGSPTSTAPQIPPSLQPYAPQQQSYYAPQQQSYYAPQQQSYYAPQPQSYYAPQPQAYSSQMNRMANLMMLSRQLQQMRGRMPTAQSTQGIGALNPYMRRPY